jgi:hypothetical protein
MKRVTQIMLLIIISSCFFLEGCDLFKQDPKPKTELEKLPPITQEGKNTFGCLVNGKALIVTNTSQMAAVYQAGGLSVSGGNDVNGEFWAVELFVNEAISKNSTYNLYNDTNHKGQLYDEKSLCFYFTNSEHQGTITITHFDSSAFIISGLFQFEAISDQCLGIIKITEGRFDMQYIP